MRRSVRVARGAYAAIEHCLTTTVDMEVLMNRDELNGKWTQVKGEAQRKWGKLTNDDLDVVSGDAKKLAGKIQERYGKAKDEAEREVNQWIEKQ
jgi:uncharacterized protein YjbJ (UPF0337 family)